MMLALIGALLLVVGLLHAPFPYDVTRVGWSTRSESYAPLVETREFRALREMGGMIPTSFQPTAPEAPAMAEEDAFPSTDAGVEPAAERRAVRLEARRVLEFAEKAPQIHGGMGSYYIHIEYPPRAVEMGIEGQLVLRFVVEPDGSTSEVTVYKSLHPLCDSAAVRALRMTQFAPGQQDGESVAVRMSLPVRFRLVEPGTRTDAVRLTRVKAAQLD